MKRLIIGFAAFLVLAGLLFATCWPVLTEWAKTRPSFDAVAICVDGQTLQVEHADSFWKRLWGLSQIESPPLDGMLFTYTSTQLAGEDKFWMYRTRFPLQIAFIAEKGLIVDAQTMPACTAVKEKCPSFSSSSDYVMALEIPPSDAPTLRVGQLIGIGECR